jgi:hypothetical protein
VLDMRPACERCGAALPQDGNARICSYECTFCPACSDEMSGRCPNCGGELLPRPRRAPADPPADLVPLSVFAAFPGIYDCPEPPGPVRQ